MTADDVADVRASFDRTSAAGTARLDYATEMTWKLPQFPEPENRSAIRRAVTDAGKAAGKTIGKGLLRLVSRGGDLRHQQAEGFVDLAGRRWMLDYGSYARLQIDDNEWSGRSGRALSTLPSDRPRLTSPLWMIDLIAGVNGAVDHGTAEVDGHRWRHLTITASLPDAAAAHSGSMSTPARDQYDELLALPLEVWLDDHYLRRIRFETDGGINIVTLNDFGVVIDDLDWSRLPSFRTEEDTTARRRQGT